MVILYWKYIKDCLVTAPLFDIILSVSIRCHDWCT